MTSIKVEAKPLSGSYGANHQYFTTK